MPDRPVLLVHGAWHGPWCWDEWSAALADAGYRPRAIALPGHTEPGTTHRIWNRLGEYVEAVGSELDFLGPDTVVVAHSMGGLVAQKMLERRSAALGILLASVPLRGVWGATARTAREIPLPFLATTALASMYPIVGTPRLTGRAFFTDDTPPEVVEGCHQRLQNESFLAYLQMFALWPRPRKVRTPIRVVAGGQDDIFTVDEEQRLAAAYDTVAVVIEDAGHDLMLDPEGRPALDQILAWIDELD